MFLRRLSAPRRPEQVNALHTPTTFLDVYDKDNRTIEPNRLG
jgi:hypothetical protein